MPLSILVVRALVEGVEHAGGPRDAFLAAAGYDAAWVEDPDTRVPVEEYDRLVELAIEFTGDRALGLHMAEAASATTYSVVAHLFTYAKTLRQAVESYFRFHRLLTDRVAFQLTENGQTSTLVFQVPPGSRLCQRFHAELTVAGLVRAVQLFGSGEGIHRVSFVHAEPGHVAEYARLFQGRERFEQAAAGVTFDSELLDRPRAYADTGLHAALEAHAQQRVSRLSSQATFRDRVLDYLREHATIEHAHEMSAAAADLGISVRTLRRRLEEERTSYSELAKEALASRAERLVADTHRTIDETAYLLGFSQRSAFHRAFKRWTGLTPNEYRRQLTRANGASVHR